MSEAERQPARPQPGGVPTYDDLPLRSRLRDYLVIWTLGAGGAVLVGAVFNGIEGAGYALLFLGIGFLLVGGTTGAGFTGHRVGALARKIGRRSGDGEPERPQRRKGRTLPEANPQAFWSVIAGFAYVGVGFWLIG